MSERKSQKPLPNVTRNKIEFRVPFVTLMLRYEVVMIMIGRLTDLLPILSNLVYEPCMPCQNAKKINYGKHFYRPPYIKSRYKSNKNQDYMAKVSSTSVLKGHY